MPVYKDEERNTWFVKTYYTDYTGAKKQKKKRGFKLQREAKEWERTFLEKHQGTPDMSFQALYELYIEDLTTRLKLNSIYGKKRIFINHILPFFKEKAINEIKPSDIRKWQNELISKNYSDAYLNRLHNALVAVFNYAITYYNLASNPCHKAGRMGKKIIVVNFWTETEYLQFLDTVISKELKAAFQILYYTGIRSGELFALTPADIDFTQNTIYITKSFIRVDGKDMTTSPKTPKSIREVTVSDFVLEDIRAHMETLYGLEDDSRLFSFSRTKISYAIKLGCRATGIKIIRTHDLRHSHASLLIEMGFSPMIISERLGHEKVETTLTTYSHLYPNKQNEVANKLQERFVANSTKSVP